LIAHCIGNSAHAVVPPGATPLEHGGSTSQASALSLSKQIAGRNPKFAGFAVE
jgi:hypothetical protein